MVVYWLSLLCTDLERGERENEAVARARRRAIRQWCLLTLGIVLNTWLLYIWGYDAGHDEGEAEGYERGHDDGVEEGLDVGEEAGRLGKPSKKIFFHNCHHQESTVRMD